MAIFTIPCFAVNGLYNHDYHFYGDPNTLYSNTIAFYNPDSEYATNQKFKAQPFSCDIGNKPTSLNGYTPKNKKLLTYPYTYLGSSSNNSSKHIYKFEHFTNNRINFKAISEINPNPSVYLIPQNYKNVTNNINEALIIGGYPQISWVSDAFNAWLAQNSALLSINMEQEQFNFDLSANYMINNYKNEAWNVWSNSMGSMTSSLGSMATSKKSADFIGGGINTALSMGNSVADVDSFINKKEYDAKMLRNNHDVYIAQQMAQIEKQKLLPNTANFGSSNATLLGYNNIDDHVFTIFSIQYQFAERIDKYFDMYGYATKEVKIPNLNNRPNWNYVKTTGANIIGNIPQEDLETIKDLFNLGITLWHNSSTFLDYSQNNR